MAWEQARRSLLARLTDPTTGIAARLPSLAATLGIDPAVLTTPLSFPRAWQLSTHLRNTTTTEYAVRPLLADAPEKPHENTGTRITVVRFEVQCSVFGADADVLADLIAVHAAAFTQCLDRLPEWSQANGGTIATLGDVAQFEFGTFDDLPTNASFRAQFTLSERSPL